MGGKVPTTDATVYIQEGGEDSINHVHVHIIPRDANE